MKLNKYFLIILGLIISTSLYSQIKDFIIITFEFDQKVKSIENYYWIVPLDSIIQRSDVVVYPIYFDEFSKDDLEKCITSDSIHIFISTGISNCDFENEYLKNIDSLKTLVKKYKNKVQTIDIDWTYGKTKGKKIRTNVYITPISGYFCNCINTFKIYNPEKSYINKLVFLPISNFIYNKDFWNTKKSILVKFSNYSFVNFRNASSISYIKVE